MLLQLYPFDNKWTISNWLLHFCSYCRSDDVHITESETFCEISFFDFSIGWTSPPQWFPSERCDKTEEDRQEIGYITWVLLCVKEKLSTFLTFFIDMSRGKNSFISLLVLSYLWGLVCINKLHDSPKYFLHCFSLSRLMKFGATTLTINQCK